MKMPGFAALLAALALPAAAPPQDASLGDRIDALVRGLRGAKAGVLVRAVGAAQAVYASREQEPFQLASNTKLFTTAAALDRLGPDFRFRTSVGAAGGHLHVFGGGDPNISGRFHDDNPTAVFSQWAAKLKAAGVTRVENLVLHTGIFDEERVCPGWKSYDPWFWWAAPFGPLSLNDNCVDLTIEPGPEGEPCKVSLSPDTSGVTIVNRTRTTDKPARPFGFTRAAGTNTITLAGEVSSKARPGTWWVAIHDPTMYFGTVLKETLAREGVTVAGRIEESTAAPSEVEGFKELAVHESGLAATIAVCNRSSHNFYAEMILRTLAWKLRGKGTRENGLAVVQAFLKEAGVEKASLADGSGLTRDNLASPEDVVKLLLFMRGHKHAKEFLESLPEGGMPGSTLRNRLKAGDLRGRVRAKTGHLAGVSTLSGFAESVGGETYAFSILVNAEGGGIPAGADRLQDRICGLLARNKE
jgi:D-alanyl-D-alanine carboxypeptidase/D-alanyl-D-alanine-endopeptidase (penicillin-binding protein 4)